jgi:hypothetical protein
LTQLVWTANLVILRYEGSVFTVVRAKRNSRSLEELYTSFIMQTTGLSIEEIEEL